MTSSVPGYTEKTWQGDGSTTAFPFQTLVEESGDIRVWLIEDGVSTLQSLTTHYTLSGLGGAGGVTVTFVTAPSATQTVRVARRTVPKQTVDYGDTTKVPGDTTEAQLDRLAMHGQDADTRLNDHEGRIEDIEDDLDAYDDLTDRFLGKYATDALATAAAGSPSEGQIYWNTTSKVFRYFDGSTWQAFPYATVADGAVTRVKLLSALKPAVSITPEEYGAAADGSDDTAALQAAFNAGSSTNTPVLLTPGKTYTFSELSIPNGSVVYGAGAVLRSDGSLTVADTVALVIGDDCLITNLEFSTPGTETLGGQVISIGARTSIQTLIAKADQQRNGGGIATTADHVWLGYVETENIDRPLYFNNDGDPLPAKTEGGYCGFLKCTNYVRAFSAVNTDNWHIGGIHAEGRSANASVSPGHNTVLLNGCVGFTMGGTYGADAGEHTFRVGGAGASDFSVGVITSINAGGCALKLNPGDTGALVERGSFVGVDGIDVGDGTAAGNRELLRLTHCRQITLGYAHAWLDDETFSGQHGIQLNDCQNVTIESLGGEAIQGSFVVFDETSDASPNGCSNIRINRIWGACSGNNAFTFAMPNYSVSNVFMRGLEVDIDADLVFFNTSGTYSGVISMQGRVFGATASPILENKTAPGSIFKLDIEYASGRQMGDGQYIREGVEALQWGQGQPFSSSNVTPRGVFINGIAGTEGLGNYGASLEFSRVGSTRRGAAVVAKQTGSNAQDVGLSFLAGAGTVGTDAITERAVLDHQGNFSITGSLSKGSGTFKIDHPLDIGIKDLIHGFVESPRYDLIYRGVVRLAEGRAVVQIDEASNLSPGTFAALTQNAEVIALHNKDGFSRVRTHPISEGTFEIECEDPISTDEISWMVIAERADRFIIEDDPWTDAQGRLVPEWIKGTLDV